MIAFAVTLIVGRMLIPALRRLKAGQSIREDGPTWHMSKQGTPTMGGLMFIIGIGAAVLIAGLRGMMMGSFVHLYVFVFALVFGIIGYIDDYKKVTRAPERRPDGVAEICSAAGCGGGIPDA